MENMNGGGKGCKRNTEEERMKEKKNGYRRDGETQTKGNWKVDYGEVLHFN